MKHLFLLVLFLLCNQLAKSQTFDVETIQSSGTIDKRINLVILGDGYKSNELTKFITDATNFTAALFAESPYKEYKDYFNVVAIKVPSNESGAIHPGTATDVTEPVHPVANVDNYFGSTFDFAGIHRLLVPTKSSAITSVLANNFPTYDQVLILVNSQYYGGSGGAYATSSTNAASNEISIHEIGHSFSFLIDEYYAGDRFSREGINMTQETDPLNVRWKNWYNDNGIGIYQHCCSGNSASWYRPHQNCKMRALSNPFCSVCIEGTIERIHDLVSPIDSYSPGNTGTIENPAPPLSFTLNLIEPNPNTLSVKWNLNGAETTNTSNTITIAANELIAGVNQLQAVVEDVTTFLRIDSHQTIHVSTVQWTIDATTLSIDDISEDRLKIELFPNPTNNFLNVSIKTSLFTASSIKVYDSAGRQLIDKKITEQLDTVQIPISNLSAGTYIINFYLSNGSVISKKFIKE